jgi:diguanylate cyclase (GGDEF)-like protein
VPARAARLRRTFAGRARAHRRIGVWASVACLLVAGGALASLLGARAAARSNADKARLSFHLASAEIASTLTLAIQHEEDLIISASAFFAGNPQATPADFDRWTQAVRAMNRYPELQNIGLVKIVPAARLAAFETSLAADPVRPLGPNSLPPREPFTILPAGSRPYYCFAVAGLARDMASYLPAGIDYCALAPTLITARDKGEDSYAPVSTRRGPALGIETPVYRGGVTPSSVAARRRAFVGWIGELIAPRVVLARALQGHPNVAVRFRYQSTGAQVDSQVAFTSGTAPAHAQHTEISLGNGWTVQSFGAPVSMSVLHNSGALTLLIGGALLSVLMGVLVLVLATGRTRARALVREKTRELSHLALHDPLTGLPNRALVRDRAEQLLARTSRNADAIAGALYVDIDGFKHVNDTLGHAAGDRLLTVAGERLLGAVREQDTVGRLGGDEFIVLVESTSGGPAPDVLADRLIEALREPVELGEAGKSFTVTASIGVAAGSYASPDELFRDADLALYAAKAAGKDRHVLFDAGMYGDAEGRLALQTDLGSAVAERQLFLVYQPIFDLARQHVVGAEALVRWRHPQRGVVAPGNFIPLAEESRLIVPIGRWVLDEACRQAAAWAADGLRLGVSVNVSAYQLNRSDFAQDVQHALASSGVAPSMLTLEITETALVRDVRAACERLHEVKALGVRVAIDDFGTGYASLSHLQRLPVDILKIDRSFIAALSDGGQSRALLEAILGVGHSLSLSVVAEGIEERDQRAMLEEMGCQMAQGFLLGHPGPAEGIVELLSRRLREGTAVPTAG